MLFSNNLKIDKNLRIPSNDKEFFLIDKYWDFSQKLVFNVDTVYVDNLYVIIQSYLWNSQIRTLRLYTFMQNDGENRILSYNNVFIVKKMNFFFFSNWWDNVSNYDKQYLTPHSIYGMVIVFSVQSLEAFANKHQISVEELYTSLKPSYPWNQNIINLLNAFK
jgi:hypothetical protein